ncbi:MAG TPA: hypothetical protein VFU20_02140, partial [Sphingomicrobium sp.]|nr:hypothetical protein [Sphingomicrobium sp.]
MRAGSRFIAALAAALAFAAVPALAQDSSAPATNAPAETIGPSELQDFSLNGTVTRPAPAPPARTAPAPRPTVQRTAPAPETRAAPAPDRPRAS